MNDIKAAKPLSDGRDVLSLAPPELDIIYQDEYMVAVNKPAGMLVHKSIIDRHEHVFVMKLLRDQLGQWVYPVHRLDKPTSGVLLFALSSEIAREISQSFENKLCKKSYVAVVRGFVDGAGRIDHALTVKLDKIADKDADQDKPAQAAATDFKCLATVEIDVAIGRYDKSRYSLVALYPQSGRKHQLRRHMKHVYHPMIGDTTYGEGRHNRLFREKYGCSRLLLAATRLELPHPIENKMVTIVAALDPPFMGVIAALGWTGVELT